MGNKASEDPTGLEANTQKHFVAKVNGLGS